MRQGRVNRKIQTQIMKMNLKTAMMDQKSASRKVPNRFEAERLLPLYKPRDFLYKDKKLRSDEIHEIVS